MKVVILGGGVGGTIVGNIVACRLKEGAEVIVEI